MNDLQLFSFEINSNNIIEKTIYVMKFPKELKDLINRLKSLKAKEFGYTFALKGLAKIVKNYSRDVLSVNSNHSDLITKDKPWICSTARFNLEGLKLHVCQWINNELKRASNLNEDFYIESDFIWDSEISIKDIFNESFNIYDILPNLYARDICKKPIYFQSTNRDFQFYPIIKDNSVSLISEVIPNKYGEPLSYNIDITLVKPFDGEGKLYLNIALGTKLWQNKPLIIETRNSVTREGTSAYVFKKDEFIKEQQITFIQCYFKRDYSNVKWKNSYDDVYAEQIGLNINKIVREPAQYMDFNSNLICLITNKKKDSYTKRGAGIAERIDIFKIFRDLYPDLEPKAQIKGISYNKISKSTVINKTDNRLTNLKHIKLKRWIKNPLRCSNDFEINKFVIDIYTDNEKLYEDSRKLSKMILGLSGKANKYVSPQGLEFKFNNIKGNIMRALKENEDKIGRVREIEKETAFDRQVCEKHVALIDIPAFHKNKDKSKNEDFSKLDSKQIVRAALKNNDTMTQFINGYNDKGDYHKLINALYDLFYSAGFLNDEFYKLGFDNKVLIGLDFIPGYSDRYLVMSKISKGIVYYKIYKDEYWIEASEFICSLDENKLKKSYDILKKEMANGVNDWIWNTLQDEIDLTDEEIILFADASLRNRYWKFLTNSNYCLGNIEVEDKHCKLKIARVNNTSENPDYCIGDGTPNLFKGLFTNDNITFYMVGARSDTFKINNKHTKYDHLSTPFVKQRLTEVIILGGRSEAERETAAKDCYTLRRLVPTYEKEVLLPLPMYFIKRIGEYIEAMENVR
ncbi:hypothetical protein HMPREF1982_01324 [Clostridiales bacterium oral taxon 876 str. F0540]|nr:hypothetical protein HMPREF1982_01324 [Clostridiales bacterium oral taxon 876 str. F0540]